MVDESVSQWVSIEKRAKRERKRDTFVIHKGMFSILLVYSQFVVEIEGIIFIRSNVKRYIQGTKTIFDLISGNTREIAPSSNSQFSLLDD